MARCEPRTFPTCRYCNFDAQCWHPASHCNTRIIGLKLHRIPAAMQRRPRRRKMVLSISMAGVLIRKRRWTNSFLSRFPNTAGIRILTTPTRSLKWFVLLPDQEKHRMPTLQSPQARPPSSVITRPCCSKCRSNMIPARVIPGMGALSRRIFECSKCRHIEVMAAIPINWSSEV
jgi:hypothetical protein